MSDEAKTEASETATPPKEMSAVARLVRIFAIVAIILLVIVVSAKVFLSHELPKSPKAGPEAEALTKKILAAVGSESWSKVGAISWTFANRNKHIWDRKRQCAQVTNGDLVVQLHIPTRKGLAKRGNTALTGAELQRALDFAYKAWVNDRFWLCPFETFYDKDVKREFVNDNQLLITYGSGGVTPGDKYLWIVDDKGLPKEWQMWVSIIPIDGLSTSWTNWGSFDGMMISQQHKIANLLTLDLTSVNTAPDVLIINEQKDPFAELFSKVVNAQATTTSTPNSQPNRKEAPKPSSRPSAK